MRIILTCLSLLVLSGCAAHAHGNSTSPQARRNDDELVCSYQRQTGSMIATKACCPRNTGRPYQATNFVTYQYRLAEGRGDDTQRHCPGLSHNPY